MLEAVFLQKIYHRLRARTASYLIDVIATVRGSIFMKSMSSDFRDSFSAADVVVADFAGSHRSNSGGWPMALAHAQTLRCSL
jgi:hypothetical protein